MRRRRRAPCRRSDHHAPHRPALSSRRVRWSARRRSGRAVVAGLRLPGALAWCSVTLFCSSRGEFCCACVEALRCFTPARRERVEVDAVAMSQELGGTTSALQTATGHECARCPLCSREPRGLELWEERVLNASRRQHASLQRAIATCSEAWARQKRRRRRPSRSAPCGPDARCPKQVLLFAAAHRG